MYSDLNFYPCEEYSCTELFKDKACKRVQDLGFYFNRKYEIGCDSKGFGLALKNPDSVNLVKLKKTAMEAVKRHTKVTKDSELRNTDFEELFALTHDNIKKYALKGMTIWLVTLPTTPFYAESLNSYQREKMMEAIHTMCRQNRNCHYLNLLQAPQFNLIDFHDGDHLAPRGARKLAGILDSILSKN
jgi:hypothetical protein